MNERYFFKLTLKGGEDQRSRICDCFEYLCDTHGYIVAFENGRFQHYQGGKQNLHHDDSYMAYDTGNGNEIRKATIRDGELFSGPIDGSDMNDRGPIYCMDWSKRIWKVELVENVGMSV